MRQYKRAGVYLLAAAMVGGLGACASPATPAPVKPSESTFSIDGELIADEALWAEAQGGNVHVSSALSEATEQKILDAFTADTGIATTLTRLPTPKLVERVLSEHGAGKPSFDVVRLTDSTAAQALGDEGALALPETPFDEQLLADGARAEGQDFVDSFYSIYVFAYNTQTVSANDAPKSWEDLLDAKFDGKIGLVNANGSGNNIALADMWIEAFGEDYLEDLASLSPVIFDSVGPQGDALARGELSIITVSLGTALTLKAQGAPIEPVIPRGEPTSGTGMAFALTTKGVDSAAARVFLNWQMSKAGQAVAGAEGFPSSRSDVGKLTAGGFDLPEPGSRELDIYTAEERSKREVKILEVWNAAFNYAP